MGSPDHPPPDPPKISLLPQQFSFFLPSLGVFLWKFGGVFEGRGPLMCTLGVHGLSCAALAALGAIPSKCLGPSHLPTNMWTGSRRNISRSIRPVAARVLMNLARVFKLINLSGDSAESTRVGNHHGGCWKSCCLRDHSQSHGR